MPPRDDDSAVELFPAQPVPLHLPGTLPAAVQRDDDDLVDRIFDYILAEMPELHKAAIALKPQVRAEFNGERCYITTNTPSERQQLVQQVLSQFNGRNATEVARTLRISRATVYRYLKQPG